MMKNSFGTKVKVEELDVGGNLLSRLHEEQSTDFVQEPERRVPVAGECDVLVAGAGVSGLFAAIAAGRTGADTILVDRFGAVGGNMGPGWINKGTLEGPPGKVLPGGRAGIPGDFLERLEKIRRRKSDGGDEEPDNTEDANIVSYLGMKMCEEAGVDLILSAYAADSIVENGMVRGLFIEGKSGRVAIKAKVVIDGTGDASIAERGGAPMITRVPPRDEYALLISKSRLLKEFEGWNETGLPYLVRNLDGVVRGHIGFKGQFDTNSMAQISFIEKHLRIKAFESVLNSRASRPGSYLLAAAPYIGARGGPCIEGEHVLTIEEAWKGVPFPDVIFKNIFRRAHAKEGYNRQGFETPYRILLPRGLDGLLVVGRGASYIRRGHDGTGNRVRLSLMTMGQAAGTAAAIAVRDGTTTKTVEVRKIQREMLKEGYRLGDENRLNELGLSD